MATIDYKEKLRLAKEALESGSYDKETIEYIFPELAESEDERIRKHLIGVVELYYGNTDEQEKKDCLAWLEKQGDKNKFIEKELGCIKGYREKAIKRLEELEKQGEQKPSFEMKIPEESLGIDSDTYSKIVDECIYGEQKPAWSEEDEEEANYIADFIENLIKKEKLVSKKTMTMEEMVAWLRDIKYRYLPKPEQGWGEEDEKMLNDIIMCGEHHCYLDAGNIAWLKSLRPQSTWKPSDEQMEYLAKAIVTLGEQGDCKTASILNYLRVELKKLRGE